MRHLTNAELGTIARQFAKGFLDDLPNCDEESRDDRADDQSYRPEHGKTSKRTYQNK